MKSIKVLCMHLLQPRRGSQKISKVGYNIYLLFSPLASHNYPPLPPSNLPKERRRKTKNASNFVAKLNVFDGLDIE